MFLINAKPNQISNLTFRIADRCDSSRQYRRSIIPARVINRGFFPLTLVTYPSTAEFKNGEQFDAPLVRVRSISQWHRAINPPIPHKLLTRKHA